MNEISSDTTCSIFPEPKVKVAKEPSLCVIPEEIILSNLPKISPSCNVDAGARNTLRLENGEAVILTSCDSLNQFFVVRQSDFLSVKKMSFLMQEMWNRSDSNLEDVKVGDILLCEDKLEYHRVIVTDVESSNIKVFFVDRGRSRSVDVATVKRLTDSSFSLSTIPPAAHQCCILREVEQWSFQALIKFRDFCGSEPLNVIVDLHIINEDKRSISVIDLVKVDNGVPISVRQFLSYRDMMKNYAFKSPVDFILEKPLLAQKLDPNTKEYNVQVVFINNPSDLFVTLKWETSCSSEYSNKLLARIAEGIR